MSITRTHHLLSGLAGSLVILSAAPVWAQDQMPPSPRTVASPTVAATTSDTLQTVLASVYRNNPQLLGERARLREVDETYIQARAQGRASISAAGEVSAQAVRTPVTAGGFFGPQTGGWNEGTPSSAQLSVIQPIYQGGRVTALKRQAKAGIMAARAGLESAENNIFLSAANAYVDILRDEEAARIRRNNVRVLNRQLTAANDRFNVGEGTRTDIAQSESRMAAAEAGLAQADAQLEISRALFVRIVGRLPNQLAPAPDFALPESLEEATRLARSNNPQLLAAYYNEQAGSAAIDVAKAAGRPTVSLQGTLAGSRDTILGISETDQATIAAQLSIPIFSGGLNASRVRQAKNAKTRLAFETRDTERAVDQTITQVWARMDAARRIVQTSRRQVAAAEVAFEGVTLEQQVGTRTQLDVLDAEQETLNARLTLINAERDFDASVFQLLSAIGVLDADGIDLPIATYDPDVYLSNIVYDGYKEAGDRLLPEAVQKIGGQVPDIILEPAGLVVRGVNASELDNAVKGVGDTLWDAGRALKEGVDAVTFQEPHYDPRITDPDIVIVTDTYQGQGKGIPEPDIVLMIDREDVPDNTIDEAVKGSETLILPIVSEPSEDGAEP